ncbi:MAG: NAD(P)/FAD-dependent oxidoreductase, partial [Xanthomonadales bacterium]|nr:NAD(P)/FAD-dependent oxidoreductase [Xanthomonadales bacterium]
GLLDDVDQYTIPMKGRMMHDVDGQQVFQPYGKDASEVIWSTHRARLNLGMLEAADRRTRVTLYFDHVIQEVDWDARTLLCVNPDGETHEHGFEVLIAADGAGSAIRQAMERVTDLGVSEELLDHGYKELNIPPDEQGRFQLDPHALHIWPRGGFMLIALPNADRSFTLTLFLPNEGKPSFSRLGEWPAQQAFMQAHFPDAVPLIAELEQEFSDNPVGLLGTIRCRKWHLDGRAVLLGDAAHAIVPFHGQGMNAAFEDCTALMDCLDKEDRDWSELFADFQAMRRDNANAIADMALENYLIMRDAVRDPGFLLRKALEHELERRHPNRFVARYSLVMFHRVPYAECYRRGEIQERILAQLLEGCETLNDVDFDRACQLIEQQLEPLEE